MSVAKVTLLKARRILVPLSLRFVLLQRAALIVTLMFTEIGGGWFEHVDEKTGKTSVIVCRRTVQTAGHIYYANASTQETQWEYPTELVRTSCTMDWDECCDPNSGRTYYFNRKTRETSWDPPASHVEDSTSKAKLAALDPSKWKSKLDLMTGQTYYYNTVTRDSTWSRPACWPDADQGEGLNLKMGATPDRAAFSGTPKATEDEDEPPEGTIEEIARRYTGYDFRRYAEEHFQLSRKGMFNTKTNLDKVLRWKNEVIKTALHITRDGELNTQAVQIFRNVTGFMGDRCSGKPRIDHCQKILSNVLQSPEVMRDETYCQIIKQVTGNPSAESTAAGWQLLAACLATFPPSSELAPHVGSYLSHHLSPTSEWPGFCLHALPKICELGARRELPTEVEVESTIRQIGTTVRIFFVDGKCASMPVDPWTTAAALVRALCRLLGICDMQPFAIFEVSTDDEERALDADERVLDVVAYWHRIETKNTPQAASAVSATIAAKVVAENFHFKFKVRYFFDVGFEDEAAVEMMYIQAKHDVVDARYPCAEQDALTLAALQFQEEFGDALTNVHDCKYLKGRLGRYFADRVVANKREDELGRKLLTLRAKLSGYSSIEARLSYLDYVRSWKIYGSTYFVAEPKQNRQVLSQIILAVNVRGIMVIDPETNGFQQEYPYSKIITWGYSPTSFVVVTGDAIKQAKNYFKTDHGREISFMVKSYVQRRTSHPTSTA